MNSNTASQLSGFELLIGNTAASLGAHRDTQREIYDESERVTTQMRVEHENTRRLILGAIFDLAQDGLQTQFPRGFSTSYTDAKKVATRFSKNALLNSLEFTAMDHRFEAVPEVYRRTFEWIFDSDAGKLPQRSNFVRWLQQDSGIYWINGKAGSGKSTLMKFIFMDKRLRQNLEAWAGTNCSLLVSHHFFWRKGTDYQKSVPGLLRSLLANIFRQRPDLMEVAVRERLDSMVQAVADHVYLTQEKDGPPRISNLGDNLQQWSVSDLTAALRCISSQATDKIKFCFLIDGLDEFDGDYEEIIDLFRDISSDHVKMCLSSRPLTIFQKRLGGYPGLRLQDLTSDDIRLYVAERLADSPGMRFMQAKHPERTGTLVTKIVDKASGVFLWVTLVVKSLLNGLVNNDTISNLEWRLDALPPDLEDLYWHMLRNIDQVYQARAPMIFQICLQTRRPVKAITLSLAEEETDHRGEAAIRAATREMSVVEQQHRCHEVSMRLQSVCSGLLEVQSGGTVAFLHRTVGDFFDKAEVKSLLHEQTLGSHFNSNMAIIYATILELKWSPARPPSPTPKQVIPRRRLMYNSPFRADSSKTTEQEDPIDDFWYIVEEALCSATRAENEGMDLDMRLMDEFDRVATLRWKEVRTDAYKVSLHWSSFIGAGSRVQTSANKEEFFFHCAIRFQLNSYLRQWLYNSPAAFRKLVERPWTLGAAIPPVVAAQTFQPAPAPQMPSPATIGLLLRAGAQPNLPYINGVSPWVSALHHVFADYDPGGGYLSDKKEHASRQNFGKAWAIVLELLLQYGADPSATFTISTWDNNTIVRSALALVRDILTYFDPDDAGRLEEKLVSRGAPYISETVSGKPVVSEVNRGFRPAITKKTTPKALALRTIASAPGVRENMHKAFQKDGSLFINKVK